MGGNQRHANRLLGALAFGALPVIVLTVILAAGCGVNIGPTQAVTIDEPLTGAGVTDITLSMGAGKLSVSAGAAGSVAGSIRYNVEPWKPVITRSDNSVTIKQGSQRGPSGLGTGVINDWTIRLGKSPINLKVTAGAYEGTYDLTGLTLQGLTIKDGAAKTQVIFNSPNLGQISDFAYSTGASEVSMTGLANANFKSMEFSGGAGSFSLEFSGQLRTDATVRVKAAVGTVKLTVPQAIAAVVTVEGSLNKVSEQGSWVTNGKTYSTPASAGGSGKTLTIKVDMNVGSLKLITE